MLKHSEKLNKIIKYLVATVLLVIPLYPKFPLVSVPGTFVSIRIEDFILAIAGVVITYVFLTDIRSFLQNKINKAILFFVLVGLLSLFSAIFVTKTVVFHIGFLHWVRRVEYFIPFFLGVLSLKKKENLEFYIKVLMISIILMFIYGLGQKNLNWPIIITQNQEYSKGVALRYIPGGHINSTFAGHYDLSTFLVMVIPVYVCLFIAIIFKKKKSYTTLLSKMFLFLTVFSGLWLLAFSGSRISVVSYLVSVSTALFLIKKHKAIPFVVVISLLIFGFSPSLRSRYLRIFEVLKSKIVYVNTSVNVYAAEEVKGVLERRILPTPTPSPAPIFEDRSTSIRFNVEWPRAIRAFSKNPLLGTGYSSITLATDNDYLRLIGEVGILGFLAFFAIIFRLGLLITKSLPFNQDFKGINLAFIGGVVGALPGILMNALFIDVFEASKFAVAFWLLIGMLVALLRKDNNEQYN